MDINTAATITVTAETEIHYRRAIAALEATIGALSAREIDIVRSHDDPKGYADWVCSVAIKAITKQMDAAAAGERDLATASVS